MDAHTDTRYDIPADDAALLAECDVWVFRSTGPGGQGVNTTDSAVRLRHRPSGITVVCRRERSQLQNKRTCLERLRGKLEAHNAALDAPERVPTRKSRAAKARQVDAKRKRSRVKRTRGRVEPGEE
jgi:protein subunit release factor B